MPPRRLMLTVFVPLLLCTAQAVRAQCSDGTRPPCEAERRAAATKAGNSVVVLYLETRSKDSTDKQLAAAVTEEMIEALGSDPRLDVRSHFVSRAFAKGDADPLAAARAQRVAWLVSGAFRGTGDSIGLRIELSRTASGRVEWTRDLPQTRVEFANQLSTLTRMIAGQVAGRMLPETKTARVHQPDPAAYLLVLRAKSLGRVYTEAGYREALVLLERAVKVDSMYASAWAYLAMTRVGLALFVQPRPVERMRVEAERALALDPDEPAGLSVLAWSRYYSRDFSAGTESLARRAVALGPRDPEAKMALAMILIVRGNPHEAVALSRAAVTMDSLSLLSWGALVGRLEEARRYDDAIAAHDRLAQLDPVGHAWRNRRSVIGSYRLREGRCTESAAEARAMADTALLIRSIACLGRRDEARAMLEGQRPRGLMPDPMMWALLAEPDSLFAEVDRREKAAPVSTVLSLMTNPAFDPYRKDPRFVAIIRRTGLDP